jgi:type IV pilus assembly protein PilW
VDDIDMTRQHTLEKAGFTLVELMVSMLLTGIIAIGIFSAYKAQQTSYVLQEQVAEMQQRVRAGMDMMLMELREAGYDPDITGVPGISTATATSLKFTMATDVANVLKTIEFSFYDQSGDAVNDTLGRKVDIGVNMPLIEGIDGLEFNYILEDGSQVTAPTTAQLKDIRSVQISVLVRAAYADPEFSQSITYTFGSGASSATYTDTFRRRLLISSVQFRNLGLNLI